MSNRHDLASTNLVKSAKEFMIQNIADKIGLEELESYIGVSRFAIARAFKKENTTPIGWLWDQRTELALAELVRQRETDPDTKISEVFPVFGFNNAQHFARCVKSSTGLSPTDYVKTKISGVVQINDQSRNNDERSDTEGTGRTKNTTVPGVVADANLA